MRKVLGMADRSEIRKAHEIVDKIDPVYEREVVRKFLPPRPKATFRETIDSLKSLVSEDDVHLWKIIEDLERFGKPYIETPVGKDEEFPFEDVPVGSLAAQKGSVEVWRKGAFSWSANDVGLAFDDERMEALGFRILRWGLGDD